MRRKKTSEEEKPVDLEDEVGKIVPLFSIPGGLRNRCCFRHNYNPEQTSHTGCSRRDSLRYMQPVNNCILIAIKKNNRRGEIPAY